MNHYRPLQREDTGTWDYTCTNDGKVHRVGYCAEAGDQGHGHATPEDACACYKRYLLDNRLDLNRRMAAQQRPCQAAGCTRFTSGLASVDMMVFVLCDEHRTRETVDKLFAVGETWSSW